MVLAWGGGLGGMGLVIEVGVAWSFGGYMKKKVGSMLEKRG